MKQQTHDHRLALKSMLRPGDTILYFSNGLFDWIIALVTWCKVAHVEMYRGDGMSYASRNGIGVNTYPLNLHNVAAIIRPVTPLDMDEIATWFETVRGQKYDWLGLLCISFLFWLIKHGQLDRMFCSELMTRLWRKGKSRPFNEDWDADRTPPSLFLATGGGWTVWQDGDLF